MAISKQVMTNQYAAAINEEVFEKLMLGQDLSGLKPVEKVQYMNGLCQSLGLNPLTKPFEIMKFQGKEIPYARKDCAEQLRSIRNVSITNLEKQMIEGGVYIVTAYAALPNGRQDSATGAVTTSGLKGDALANAMMKAETKAKRRVTLSICGLGMLDESELDTMKGAVKLNVVNTVNETPLIEDKKIDTRDIDQDCMDIAWADNSIHLQELFTKLYKHWVITKDKEALGRLIAAKDKRKAELSEANDETSVDLDTGEVKE